MAYLAIARKYRPSTFDEIVGQPHVTRTLTRALELDRIHHAFLFTGARGVGKTTAARALARCLNCVNGPTPTPCGECTACVEISHGSHPDLLEIDGASNNSVEDVRELREAVRYPPTSGKRRIYLVDEVHMLSKGAFNALLKTLEEPPPHVVFIFATTEPNKIPDTILSRVQRFDFKRIPVRLVAERLASIAQNEGATVTDDALRLIARAGEGSMRDAQSLLDQVLSAGGTELGVEEVTQMLGLVDRRLLLEMLRGLVQGDPDACLTAIEQVYEYGYELSQFTGELLEALRNATLMRLSDTSHKYVDVPEDEKKALTELTDGLDAAALSRTFNALLEVHDQVAHSSRPRIVLEMAVARLADTRPLLPMDQLLSRLETLERRIRQGGGGGGGSRQRRSGGRERRSRAPESPSADDDRPRIPEPATAPAAPVLPRASQARAPEPLRSPPRAPSTPQEPTNRPPVEASVSDRWRQFREAVRKTDAAVLANGVPIEGRGLLIVQLDDGLPLARGRRVLEHPDVARALRQSYGPQTRIEVTVKPRQDGSEPSDPLRARVMADAEVRRIIDALGATIAEVHPDEPGEET